MKTKEEMKTKKEKLLRKVFQFEEGIREGRKQTLEEIKKVIDDYQQNHQAGEMQIIWVTIEELKKRLGIRK